MRGVVVETGSLPDGTTYRVWRSPSGKRIAYIGTGVKKNGKVGRRRSIGWLRKTLRKAGE